MIASRNYCKLYFDSLQMSMDNAHRTRSLIDRLSRLGAAESWTHDINPGQAAALAYLAQANRFSRAPSHVAAYLGSTRGTVGQTLKALGKKGMVREVEGANKRSIQYELTQMGADLAHENSGITVALSNLSADQAKTLNMILSRLLRDMLASREGQSFGVCGTCTHHDHRGSSGYCRLLDVALTPPEADQICHEHKAAA